MRQYSRGHVLLFIDQNQFKPHGIRGAYSGIAKKSTGTIRKIFSNFQTTPAAKEIRDRIPGGLCFSCNIINAYSNIVNRSTDSEIVRQVFGKPSNMR